MTSELQDFRSMSGEGIPVSFRMSRRAHHKSIRLLHPGKLEIVLPHTSARSQTSPQALSEYLEQNRSWIEAAWRRSAASREAFLSSESEGLPTVVDLKAVGVRLPVTYVQSDKMSRVRLVCKDSNGAPLRLPFTTHASKIMSNDASHLCDAWSGDRQDYWSGNLLADDASKLCSAWIAQNGASLCLTGDVDNIDACAQALCAFIKKCDFLLEQYAWEIATEAKGQLGAWPASIKVMSAKQRWGSCSQDRRVRLNRKLLFFVPELARQIVLHELAHLIEMNHSKRYYAVLFSLPGASKELEKSAKKALGYVPAWYCK